MARKPTPAPEVKEAALQPGTLEADTAAANQLAVAKLAQNERVTALAKQLNYQGSTDPAVLENSAQDALRRIGMAVFELGGYLLLLKESCPHGQFLPALERLNFAPQAAQRYMQVTRRFANTASMRHLESAGVAKLIELVALDDEQLEDLTELGQTGELALDDVATMSVKQLRAAVREERQERKADAEVAAKKQARIDKLERDVLRIKKLTPDEDLAKLKKEATGIANDAEGAIVGNLRQALIALDSHGGGGGEHKVFMAGLVGQVQAQLTALREEFNLPDASSLADQELAAEVTEWAFSKGKKD
ncbi:DUF3102 domain-containing protein [Roseateles sp. DAIF2]|uniref:DUF3102 domain-containing protein n=1 Tax=Roseateles sp. DAIF2 TaxID=2714952 RepID=UPI0018A32443|nr:DUF3102 domain-containing protein [Roseateles sp. DAIF2]QPF74211.1 DUF3102 domain-containing protein [Roseateles sp. DAIF2]